MVYTHIIEPERVDPDGSYRNGAYMTPKWFCTPTYQTQIEGMTLAKAVLRGIRHACPTTVTTLSNSKWEIGRDYLTIDDKRLAKRVQEIFIKYQNLKGDSYSSCTNLKKK